METTDLVKSGNPGSDDMILLSRVWEAAPFAIVVTDLDGTTNRVNPAYERTSGYSAAEVIGKPSHIPGFGGEPDDNLEIRRTVASGRTWTGRLQNRRKDGSQYWESVTVVPQFDAEGQVCGAIAIEDDLTAETAALRKSEARFRRYFELPLHGRCITSLEKGWLEVNDRLCEILGYTREEILKKTWAEMTHPDDLAADVAEFNRVISGEIEQYRLEKRFVRKDGAIIWTEISVGCLRRDDGTVDHILCVLDDITGRKSVEAALQESEERFRLMLEHIPSISVQGYDMDGITNYWNDASEMLYGYSREEAIGKSLLDLIIPPELREDVRKAVASMSETLCAIPASELTLMRKDGSRVTVFSSHSIVRRHGRPPEFFCIDIDLTSRKIAEAAMREATDRAKDLALRAEQADRAKSEFLAVMSHELRTPLNGVIGFADLLADTDLNDDQRECARTITSSANHLLDLVNDILDFSSLEKNALVIEPKLFTVASLVDDCCVPVRKAATDKGLAFRCEVAPGTPGLLNGDARRIRQILLNIVGNAIKFTSSGSVDVRIAPVAAGTRRFVDFSVTDTGPGISPATLDRLFRPFTQGDSTLNRPFEGTGLGLAISKRLAEAMGGALNAVSTPGKGSTFTFRLPVASTEPEPATEPASATPEAPDADLPVLVVEDDPTNSFLAGKMLAAIGRRVEFAFNGKKAVEAFAPGKFSAILMDMRMPVMDGLEATRKIREAEALAGDARVRIIALTANVMPGDRERCMDAGMDDFLSKPFRKDELAAKLAVNG
jgi:PAS domain S-box-containing protein